MLRKTLYRCLVLLTFFILFCSDTYSQRARGPAAIADVFTDKSRYLTNEPVTVFVQLKQEPQPGEKATLEIVPWHLGTRTGDTISQAVDLFKQGQQPIPIRWMPPSKDFYGYLIQVRLVSASGKTLDTGYTAVDVSSQWNRFPRYGYLAHYSHAEDADPAEWISELNKFHVDGLEYYDFENRHEQPLAGTVGDPASEWKDIAGRPIERSIIDGFLAEAHRRNMMSMAYNTSYCAYDDAFTNGSGVELQWATWPKPDGPRTLQSAMALDLDGGPQWKTHRLVYMNQNAVEWQHYLFGKMAELFQAYPFDGWHVDTFGTTGGYSYQGQYVNFIEGFPAFVDNAHVFLKKPVVLNTVNTEGQDGMARSLAEFVYSELWDDHETYASVVDAAEQVHTANPEAGLVFAAYLQRQQHGKAEPKTTLFNPPSVLLADAAIFASGASHIELGDGSRMLSSEYFPADTRFSVSQDLSIQLRHYYDFLTAYENLLRYKVTIAPATVSIAGHAASPDGVPQTIWTLARQKNGRTMIHLINLLGSNDEHWRDIQAERPEPTQVQQLRVRINVDEDIRGAGWASPDVDGGMFHALAFTRGNDHGERYVELVVPSLKYWDMIVLDHQTAPSPN
jgi:dextranase